MNLNRADAPYTTWSTNLDQPPVGSLMVTGNLLLVPTRDGDPVQQQAALYALNLPDGDLRWPLPLSFEHAMVSGLAPLGDGMLIALTSTHRLEGQGALVALDEAGTERWRWAPGVQRVSAPAIAENTAYVTAGTHSLVAIDLATGEEEARAELGVTASLFAPAIEGSVAYVPCRGPHLLAMGLDGELRWRFEAKDNPNVWLDKSPLVTDERVFAVQSDGVALALHVEDGSLAWRADAGPARKSLSLPATDGTRLFIGARDGVHALDLADGREVWHFPTDRRVEAAPMVHAGVVYATCHDHCLYALDAASGKELWRYEMERRIEVAPVLTTCGDTPCILVADHGGTLAAIARPLSAQELEAAGRWLDAADLWITLGDRERAATLYEKAQAWRQAAEMWCALGRPLKQAEALERYARSLGETTCGADELAAAWQAAAQAFEAEGETEREVTCRKEVARCLELPIITLDVELEKGLVLNAWSRLKFIARNEGFGPACNLVVHAQGKQFKGQVMHTQQFANLYTDGEQSKWLDVYPLEPGDSVPLRVQVDYQDRAGAVRTCEHTIYVPVAREEDTRGEGQTINVFVSGGGAAAVGKGAVAAGAGGVAVGGDVYGDIVVGGSSAPVSPPLPATTHVLSFDRLSALDFERLCLWLVEREGYTRAEHLGLAGSEQGRDVIAYKPTPGGDELWYFQCKRYSSIGAKTLKDEVDKYLVLIEEEPDQRPVGVVFVVSCAVSARTRSAVGAYCEQHGLAYEFWALTELDMRVKRHSDLLQEFFNVTS
jgi:outer membrane protein assembly factor BamB